MDQNQILQETLEQSLQNLNKKAMKELAAQIVATVKQLQNGEPEKVSLLWTEANTPQGIKDFIYGQGIHRYNYALLLPQGQQSIDLELKYQDMVELRLPQNTLIIYKKY